VSAANDPRLVENVILVQQFCTAVTVHFFDNAVADFFNDPVYRGLTPE